ERQLDELHARHRVEDVQPDETLGRAARLGELGDGQRRRGRRDHGVVTGDAAELGEDRRLGARLLDDRLDQEGRLARELLEVGYDAYVLGVDLAAEAAADAVDAPPRALRGGLRAGPQKGVTVARGDGGQSAGDGSAPGDAEALLHVGAPLVDWSVNGESTRSDRGSAPIPAGKRSAARSVLQGEERGRDRHEPV